MATTQLQLGAWGGRRYGSFAGRVAVVLVYGPARAFAAAVYSPGAKAAATYQPGAMQAAVYQPGAKAGTAS